MCCFVLLSIVDRVRWKLDLRTLSVCVCVCITRSTLIFSCKFQSISMHSMAMAMLLTLDYYMRFPVFFFLLSYGWASTYTQKQQQHANTNRFIFNRFATENVFRFFGSTALRTSIDHTFNTLDSHASNVNEENKQRTEQLKRINIKWFCWTRSSNESDSISLWSKRELFYFVMLIE